MGVYAGIDLERYPGDRAMQWLYDNSNLFWTGFYLASGKGKGWTTETTWWRQYSTLKAMGWGIAPIYIGKQPDSPKLQMAAQQSKAVGEGYSDGLEAVRLASRAQIPAMSVLYFDLEQHALPQRWKDYYFGWMEAVLDSLYWPGIYCYPSVVPELLNSVGKQNFDRPDSPRPQVWVADTNKAGKMLGQMSFKDWVKDPQKAYPDFPTPHPSEVKVAAATSWQYAHGVTVYWLDDSKPGKPRTMPLSPVDLNTSVYRDPSKRFAE
jgi:hypothetical protein